MPRNKTGKSEIVKLSDTMLTVLHRTSNNVTNGGKTMQEAGFRNVEIRLVTKAFPVGTVPEFWDSMVRGSAPIQMMKKSMGEEMWREKEMVALGWLEETLPTLKMPLTSDAWLGVGIK